MKLFYDERDHAWSREHGDNRLYWLDDLGALPITEAVESDEGFLFGGARVMSDYRALVGSLPFILDRPQEREPLLRLDSVLEAIKPVLASVPTPRTWQIALDASVPDDIEFPLFVRTVGTSWKLGGGISRVTTRPALLDEIGELRRAFGWDATILARQWLDLASAGETSYGELPQEVRVWLLDREPIAWSFHHLHVIPDPIGFPPSEDELTRVASMARAVGSCFTARLVVADFARLIAGEWVFLEAGPGSCAGTGHERVFKAVAGQVAGLPVNLEGDAHGGPLGVLRT